LLSFFAEVGINLEDSENFEQLGRLNDRYTVSYQGRMLLISCFGAGYFNSPILNYAILNQPVSFSAENFRAPDSDVAAVGVRRHPLGSVAVFTSPRQNQEAG
jgi:hypothetical protein